MRIHNFKSFVNESYDDFGTATYRKHQALEQEIKELKDDIKQAWSDMENDPDIEIEGGPVADSWAEKIENMETELKKLEEKIKKIENPKARERRTVQTDAKKKLTKNIEDINRSVKSWPDRTLQQQAEIYKTRYKITDDLDTIVAVLKELQADKKIAGNVR